MHSWKVSVFCTIIILFIAGCSSNRSLIVLLPEADGTVGSIEVKSKLGSKVVNKAFYATQVDDMDIPPAEPEPMEKNEIMDVFGDALSAQSEFPIQFVTVTLYFHSGTAKLTKKSLELLPSIITTAKNRNSREIYVIGHADRVGTEQYNMTLSSNRAKRIKKFLSDSRIKSEIFVVSYHGEKNPLILTEDEVAEPENRRVEVIIR